VELLVTLCWAGRSPLAPGTVGSLAALPLGWWMAQLGWPGKLALLGVVNLGGALAVNAYLHRPASAAGGGTGEHDPPEVVIDELGGCLIALAFVPWQLPWVAAAFALFRLLDILKPGPIRLIDRATRNGWGVMGDDVVAGLAAGLLAAGLRWLWQAVGP